MLPMVVELVINYAATYCTTNRQTSSHPLLLLALFFLVIIPLVAKVVYQ